MGWVINDSRRIWETAMPIYCPYTAHIMPVQPSLKNHFKTLSAAKLPESWNGEFFYAKIRFEFWRVLKGSKIESWLSFSANFPRLIGSCISKAGRFSSNFPRGIGSSGKMILF